MKNRKIMKNPEKSRKIQKNQGVKNNKFFYTHVGNYVFGLL